MAGKKKDYPKKKMCKCGGQAICVKAKGGGWAVICDRLFCDKKVTGFATSREAIEAWNKEVSKA